MHWACCFFRGISLQETGTTDDVVSGFLQQKRAKKKESDKIEKRSVMIFEKLKNVKKKSVSRFVKEKAYICSAKKIL